MFLAVGNISSRLLGLETKPLELREINLEIDPSKSTMTALSFGKLRLAPLHRSHSSFPVKFVDSIEISLMFGKNFSHYRIIKELGRGGMGIVYLAEDLNLGRQVAIKTLTETALNKQHLRSRFIREAKAIAALSHPNIATIHEYGNMEDGQPYIVMELIRGEMLSDSIRENKLTIQRAIEITIDVAQALAEAHQHNIIHRDIKPSNIGITERGEVKLMDFGLAKELNGRSGDPNTAQILPNTQTCENVLIYTPPYASPEQVLGSALDSRSDLFSLGSVLYECLAGRPAFDGNNDDDIRSKVVRDDPLPPSKSNRAIPEDLDQIVLKFLAKRPDDRYQSAGACVQGLQTASQRLRADVTATRNELTGPVQPTTETIGRSTISITITNLVGSPVRRLLLAIVLVSLLVFGGWYARRRNPYQPSAAAFKWYDEGTRALHDGTYFKASKMFEEAVRQDDKFALAHARLAEAWTELGYVDKASVELSHANLLVDRSTLSRGEVLYLQAINATVSHDLKGAVQNYREMSEEGNESEKPHIYVDLGRAYEKDADLRNAIISYQEAIRRDPQYAPAYLQAGVLYARQLDFENAESALNKAYVLYGLQTNPEGLAEVLYQRGVMFKNKAILPKAREELGRALEIVRTFTNRSQEVKTLLQLSSASRTIGDTEGAMRYATEALELAGNNGLDDLKTQSLIEIGYVYFYRSETNEAEKYFQQALGLAQAQQVRVSEARALFSLGSVHIQQDEADAGIPFVKQALPFYEQNGYRKEVMLARTLLGQAYNLKGNYAEALAAFEEQLRLAKELNDSQQIGLSEKNIGSVLGSEEKYSEALVHLEQSYSIYSSIGKKLDAAYALTSKADMLWRLGDYHGAEAALNLAQSFAEQPNDQFKQLWGRLYTVRGPLALSKRDFPTAIRDAEQAIKLDTSKTKHPAIEAGYTLGLAQFLSGDKRRGRKTCEETVQMAVNSGDPRLQLGALLALAETMIESGDASGALATATKAQLLAEPADQSESLWRTLLIVARASELTGAQMKARENLLKADSVRSSLQRHWGVGYYNSYLARPDIGFYSKMLIQTAAAAK